MVSIKEAQQILKSMGLPRAQYNEMAALTLIALCGLGSDDNWSEAVRDRRTVTKGIMQHVRDAFGRDYAPNTRETFRRQVLHQFVQAHVADYNAFEPNLPTNSPRAHYAITEAALKTVQAYGSDEWIEAVTQFIADKGALAERYARQREHEMVPLRLADGTELKLSPGKHNEVQRDIVEHFGPRFAPGAKLLYMGDTAQKNLIMEDEILAGIGIDMTNHDKLPDVVLYNGEKNWLYLIEAVTSHGPMSPKRIVELEEMLKNCSAGPVYVSAFPDMAEFKKHARNIAWETEVWLSDVPDHLIHFNGDRFFGPRK